jgi:hypothetical protein
MQKNKDVRFIRKNGRIIPIKGKKSIKLPISGERLRVVNKPLKTKYPSEKSIFKAKTFKPRKFLGIDFNSKGDMKTYKLLKKLNARVESTVDGETAIVLNKRGK